MRYPESALTVCVVEGCGSSFDMHRGRCNKHYIAARKAGLLPSATPRERFAALVGPPNESGCHPWLGSIQPAGYGVFYLRGKRQLAHRVALEFATGSPVTAETVDHICRVKACVNPEHLRVASMTQQLAYQEPRKSKASRFKGVYRNSGCRSWTAAVKKQGEKIRLGTFATEEEAAMAYDRAAIEHFGEFAFQNFPNEVVKIATGGK